MDKPAMCRICLVQNVRMHVVLDNSLQELYETLTDVPFVTEDCRPMLACFFCCAQMKQCEEFQRKCLEAEELFSKMLNEDCESISSVNRGNSGFYGGFVKTTTELISIDDTCQTENNDIKEELPDFDDVQAYIIGPGKENTDDARQTENNVIQEQLPDFDDIQTFIIGPGTETIVIPDLQTHESLNSAPHHSQANPQVYVPFIKYTTVVEQTQPSPGVLTEPKYEKDTISNEQRNIEPPESTIVRNQDCILHSLLPKNNKTKINELCTVARHTSLTQSYTSQSDTKLKTLKCAQRSLLDNKHINDKATYNHLRIHHICEKPKYVIIAPRPSNDDNPNKCEICDRCFSSKHTLTKHIRIHTSEKKRFECDICQRRFNLRSTLVVHIRTHTGEKPYKCDICQYTCKNPTDLKRHILLHTGEKPHRCDICGRCFRRKQWLTSHIRTHTGEKPYKCDICQHTCKTLTDLKRHILIHTDEKPHRCDICGRCFQRKDWLTSHIRTHTSEKPYKCDICQYTCKTPTNLKRHIRTHTVTINEKSYNCNLCHQSFSTSNLLRNHLNIGHIFEKPKYVRIAPRPPNDAQNISSN